MERVKRVLVTAGLLLMLVGGFYLITSNITKYTGLLILEEIFSDRNISECLKQRDITLYINSEDSRKTLSASDIASYLPYIKIFNCVNNQKVCADKRISSFPTLIIEDKKLEDNIYKDSLLEISGC